MSLKSSFRNIGCAAVCALVLMLAGGSASAQIVNVQPVLSGLGEDGMRAEFGGSVNYKTGNVNLLLAHGSVLAFYVAGDHRVISSSKGEIGLKDDDEFLERVFSHLRWQWSINHWLTWETYGQVASDQFKSLQLRGLAGTGPRFEFISGPAVSAAFGVTYMFEHEAVTVKGSDTTIDMNNHRISTYITGRFAVSPLLSLGNTTYFQPRLDAFVDDFRIASDTSLNVALSKKLALTLSISCAYDHDPPEGIESLDTSTKVSITVKM